MTLSRPLFPGLSVLLLALFLAPALAGGHAGASPRTAQEKERRHSIRIHAVGDIMMGNDYPRSLLPSDDGASLFAGVKSALAGGDVVMGNLEGCLADGGEPLKICQDSTKCFVFRTPTRYAAHLRAAGFMVLGVANNHAWDFGPSGYDSTRRSLAANDLRWSGKADETATLVVDGLKVAVLAFCASPGFRSVSDEAGAARAVAEAHRTHDLVVVTFHGGAEGPDAARVPLSGTEYYLGENRGNLRSFSRAVIDAGADLVVGHGPHVLRGMELYRGRLVAYSLGNFCTGWGISVNGSRGLTGVLQVELARDGSFLGGRFVSCRQTRDEGLQVDPARRALREVRALSASDFPEGGLWISEDGDLSSAPSPMADPGQRKSQGIHAAS